MDTVTDQVILRLLPPAAGLAVAQLDANDHTVTALLRTTELAASCPGCAPPATRVHSRYTRILADLPWATYVVQLRLQVRKFICSVQECPRRIFTERLPAVVAPYARRTLRHADRLRTIALALGGEAGSRLAAQASMPVSSATLLRLLRRTPPRPAQTPRVLGVDDFARRKGRTYGTILVDLEQHRPIDLLPDRTAETLASWLKEHPGVEIISRDRSTEYARGATDGAPEAIQVADRFHLLTNLREALQRLLDRHRTDFRGIVLPTPTGDPALPALAQRCPVRRSPSEEGARQARQTHRLARHQAVHRLHDQGVSISAIGRAFHLSRGTVYRYLRLEAEAAAVQTRQASSRLDPYLPYLSARWRAGCHNGVQLWREVQARGFAGSRKMVAIWVHQQRQEPESTTSRKSLDCAQVAAGVDNRRGAPMGGPAPAERIPSMRKLAWLLVREASQLTPEEQATVAQVQTACPAVGVAYPLVQTFGQMVRQRTPEALASWLEAVATSNLVDLQGFAEGLERDKAAVLAALTLAWSNGQVEGQNNRLKMVKRQMYGRANFDLLRQRILEAA
jgi:transposase